VRREEQARDVVPVSRDGQRPLPASRWAQHGAEDRPGIEHIRRAVTKHGWYSAAAKIERKQYRALRREGRELMRRIRNESVG
jgi:hypothetical protein